MRYLLRHAYTILLDVQGEPYPPNLVQKQTQCENFSSQDSKTYTEYCDRYQQ